MSRAMLGICVGLAVFLILFVVIHYDRSLWQALAGFVVCFFPILLASPRQSAFVTFILVLGAAIIAWAVIANGWYDVLAGIVLAAVTAGALRVFRIRCFTPFSSSAYKNVVKKGD